MVHFLAVSLELLGNASVAITWELKRYALNLMRQLLVSAWCWFDACVAPAFAYSQRPAGLVEAEVHAFVLNVIV